MTPSTMRILGIACFVAAVAIAILNLKRFAGLGMNSLVPILMILGIVFVARAKRAGKS